MHLLRFMEPEGSVPWLQHSITSLYSEPNKSSPYPSPHTQRISKSHCLIRRRESGTETKNRYAYKITFLMRRDALFKPRKQWKLSIYSSTALVDLGSFSMQTDIYVWSGIRTHDASVREGEDCAANAFGNNENWVLYILAVVLPYGVILCAVRVEPSHVMIPY
jgi:hypothetical protein